MHHSSRKPTYVSICVALLFGLMLSAAAFGGGPAAKVTDLGWMTGSWKGTMPTGGTLEESWSKPDAGNMSALVRGAANGANNMVELIVIEEFEGSLVLHLQQWDPGMKPRSEEPTVFDLTDIGDKMVKFANRGEGPLKTLGYSNPEAGKFVISIETAQGAKFDIGLEAQ